MAADTVQTNQDTPNLRRLLQLELPVIVVLTEKRVTLEEVLNLCVGDILAFKKHNSELLDILVNDKRIGSGKTIKVGERFGVHVREIGAPRETLKKIAATVKA